MIRRAILENAWSPVLPLIRVRLSTAERNGATEEGGYALLITLWVLLLLSLLAASLAGELRSDTRVAHNRIEVAVAHGFADAGVTFAIESLIDPDTRRRWPADGQRHTIGYADGQIVASVQDEAGKLDLNAAPLPMIANLLANLQIDPSEASALLSGITLRRRQFPLPKPGGAGNGQANGQASGQGEPPLFDAARLAFAAVDEIGLAAPLSRSSYLRLRSYVTVYTRSARVNPLTAPLPVLLAIPGIKPADAAAFVEARAALVPGHAAADLPTLAGVDDFIESADLRYATVDSVATTSGGGVFAREAIIALSPERTLAPFTILHWSEAAVADELPSAPEPEPGS